MQESRPERLPPWLRSRHAPCERLFRVKQVVKSNGLHTVCETASCPNRTECWNAGTATFMILGSVCTRSCRFCNVDHGIPAEVDHDEPRRVACAVKELCLQYVVVTSVTRDDLQDGGAEQFCAVIKAIRDAAPDCQIEVLIPDFKGSRGALQTVIDASPAVLAHNIETVPSLYAQVRPQASYHQSLDVLMHAAGKGITVKSGLMLGFGEAEDEIVNVLTELVRTGCTVVTIGQYLQPSKNHLNVKKYYQPEEFVRIAGIGHALGMKKVIAGPFVRSSYHAENVYTTLYINGTSQAVKVLS